MTHRTCSSSVDLLVEEEDGSGYTERYLRGRARGPRRGDILTGRGLVEVA